MKTFVIIISITLWSHLTLGQDLQNTEQKVHTLFTKTVENDRKVKNAFLLVHSDKLNIHWNYYNNETCRKDTNNLQDYYCFHATSIGKTFTSTLIAILHEQEKLNFSDPIFKYLPEDIVTGLNTYNETDYSNQILIHQLLNHTSGIPDFLSAKNTDGEEFLEYCIKNPDKSWTIIETIDWAKTFGISTFPPGEGYKYTDTEYQLLGLIIEKITGLSFQEALDSFIFSPLKMNNTALWLYSEPKIKSKHQLTKVYINKTEITTFQSINFDWAAGGITSTSENLLIFMKALNKNTLLKASTYKQMQQWVQDIRGMYYGYGLMQFRIKELLFTLPDETITGHSGSIGSFMYYNPTYDIYFIGSFNQSKYQKKHIQFIIKVLNIIMKDLV